MVYWACRVANVRSGRRGAPWRHQIAGAMGSGDQPIPDDLSGARSSGCDALGFHAQGGVGGGRCASDEYGIFYLQHANTVGSGKSLASNLPGTLAGIG